MKTKHTSPQLPRGARLTGAGLALAFGLLLSTLSSFAGITLSVNGGNSAIVNAGDPIILTWEATPDTWRVERGWGGAFVTAMPHSGSETVPAANPAVATAYGLSVRATTSAGASSSAAVQVIVLPGPVTPDCAPIIWTPSLGFYEQSILSF